MIMLCLFVVLQPLTFSSFYNTYKVFFASLGLTPDICHASDGRAVKAHFTQRSVQVSQIHISLIFP